MSQDSILMAILLLAPVAGFLFNGLRFRSTDYKVAGIVATAAVAISFACGMIFFLKLIGMSEHERVIRVDFYNWLTLGALELPVAFVMDPLSSLMVLIITGVGALIHLFSIGYMSHDERPAKYFSYLNLFIFNMLLLVLGANLVLMFVGWEGVGLCSYLLIGFWFSDKEKAAAGMKAFVVNRIGDAGFLLGIFALFFTFGTLDFAQLISVLPAEVDPTWTGMITLSALFLFIGAAGKSAQIPLYVWLPDAMAGPTPVSALIHAATMVTAGVYMIIRLNPLYLLAPNAMLVVAIIGAATALFAATMGLAQNDIKRVLAYSTVSQLGYMFLAVGVGAFTAGFFHLMTHAFFKALMFLGSGSVIHAMDGEQDMRKMGGLKKYLPITHFTFVCGWLAIIGAPFFSGFFSKDEILWMSFHSPRGSEVFWLIGVFGAICTAFYMTRLMGMTFWGASRVPKEVHPHESPLSMTVPLMVLAVLAVFAGWVGVPHVLSNILPGHIPNLLEHWMAPVVRPVPGMGHAEASLEMLLMAISVAGAAVSALMAYYLYAVNPKAVHSLVSAFGPLKNLVANKYYIDELYEKTLIGPLVRFSRALWTRVDIKIIDRATYLLSDFVRNAGDGIRAAQTGQLQAYALVLVVGVVISAVLLIV